MEPASFDVGSITELVDRMKGVQQVTDRNAGLNRPSSDNRHWFDSSVAAVFEVDRRAPMPLQDRRD